MRNLFLASCSAFAVLTTSAQAQTAAAGAEFRHPCEGSPWWVETDAKFSDFDFWLGEWQVYDAESGELRGFDDVEKVLEGCVVKQHWRQMDDNFTQPGLPWRLQGNSLSGITAGGEWRQIWTDNNGGNLLFTGGYDENGRMSLVSEWYSVPGQDGETIRMRNFWHWEPQADGTIKNWGFVQSPDESAEKRRYFNIVYRKSAVGSAAAQLRKPKE